MHTQTHTVNCTIGLKLTLIVFLLVMVQYIVYRDYRDKPFRDNYIVTKAIA